MHAIDYKHANQRTLWRKQDGLVIIVDTAGSTTAPVASQVTLVATSGTGSTFRSVAIPPHL